MKNILLINGWSDDNKGDAAITQGLIKIIEVELGTPTQFSIISNFSEESNAFYEHYRHTVHAADNVEALGSLLPVTTFAKNKVVKTLLRFGLLLRSFLIFLFAPWSFVQGLLGTKQQESLKRFKKADIVISKGGHIYFSTGSFLSLVGLYQNLYPLILAQRLKKPTVIYAQSIGPIKGYWQRKLARAALLRTDRIYVRESLSLNLVNDLLGKEKAVFAWDTAFGIEASLLPNETLRDLPERFIAITIRQWQFPYQANKSEDFYTKYLKAIAFLIQKINRELNIVVVLVPQVIGPTALENDLTAMQDLKKHLMPDDKVMFLKDDFTPSQLQTIYARADLLVGTRFHSVILALAAGTPALAISYHGYKTQGIMEMLDLSELVFDINNLEQASLEKVFFDTYHNRLDYSEKIRKRVQDVVGQNHHEIKTMLELI